MASLRLAETAEDAMDGHEPLMFLSGSASSAVVSYLAIESLLRFLVFAYCYFCLATVVTFALLTAGS